MKLLVALILFVLPVSESRAYLDPGTGSILIQGLIAGVAAAALIIRTYWYRIKSFFSGDSANDSSDDETKPTQAEQRDTSV